MSKIVVGDTVKYKAGRGYAVGKVVNLIEDKGKASVKSASGRIVNRDLGQLSKVPANG